MRRSKTTRSPQVPPGLWILGATWLILTAVVVSFAIRGLSSTPSQRSDVPSVAIASGHDLRIRPSDLKLGEMRLFTYPGAARVRQILVQRDGEGKPRVAFATCRSCDASGQAAYVQHGQLYCGRCWTPMHIPPDQNDLRSNNGCAAIAIPYSLEADELVVHAADIERGLKGLDASAASSLAMTTSSRVQAFR